MNLAILGAGGIAVKMANTVSKMNDVHCYAVASRDKSKAEKFKQEHGFEKAYGSYEEMLADGNVDLVYVATPHSHHCEHTMLTLNAGHHVLCEKAFAVNAKQARQMIELAREKKLLLTEAIWPRYMPSRKIIDDVIASGIIGEITTLQADLGYSIDMNERIREPSLAGGALLDLTVYPLNFMAMAFGTDIKSMTGTAIMMDTGVDGADVVAVEYNDGRTASLFTTTHAKTARLGIISGRDGFIKVTNINNPELIEVFDANYKCVKTFEIPPQITGYEYEVLSAMKAINEGALECPEMPHAETIRIMEWCDNLRAQWNMKLPCE